MLAYSTESCKEIVPGTGGCVKWYTLADLKQCAPFFVAAFFFYWKSVGNRVDSVKRLSLPYEKVLDTCHTALRRHLPLWA